MIELAAKEQYPNELPQNYVDSVLKRRFNNQQIGNRIRHFKAMGQGLNLTEELNKARQLMSYDRKQKNNVVRSIKELLLRDGVEINWSMKPNHNLGRARVESKQIMHLKKLSKHTITESHQTSEMIGMVAAAFAESSV